MLTCANVVMDAVTAASAAGVLTGVHTIAKAVGSDVTNVIRSCLREQRFGAAIVLLTTYLAHDEVVAVSEYTRGQLVLAAETVDEHCGTLFAQQCRARVVVSYPPIDTSAYLDRDPREVDAALARRGLDRDGYVLFLSRVTKAKGADDLVAAYAASRARDRVKLVVAGTGPALAQVRALAGDDGRVVFLTDVDDDEKPLRIPALTAADRVVLEMSEHERRSLERRGREHALAFDRVRVFDDLFSPEVSPLQRAATIASLGLPDE